MTYQEAYRLGKETLLSAGIVEAGLEARLLLEFVCGTSHSDLLAHGERILEDGRESVYQEMIKQRASRIPLQHLTGVQEFMGFEFYVNDQVLIPRQDTEILVEEALRSLHDGMRILDLCTGSGCILISLLAYSNGCEGVGADLSQEALAVAARNTKKLLGERLPDEADGDSSSRIRFVRSDLFEQISGKFDIIVSNPPYVRSGVIETLMPEVREHEPGMALDGGADGLAFYRRIAAESGAYLYGGGMLFLEIGCDQGEAVSALLEQNGFLEVRVVRDYAGLDRVVYGTRGFGDPQGDLRDGGNLCLTG